VGLFWFNLLIFPTVESFDFSDTVTSHFSFSFLFFFFCQHTEINISRFCYGGFRVVAFKISLLVPGFRNTWASETRYLFIDLFSMQ